MNKKERNKSANALLSWTMFQSFILSIIVTGITINDSNQGFFGKVVLGTFLVVGFFSILCLISVDFGNMDEKRNQKMRKRRTDTVQETTKAA